MKLILLILFVFSLSPTHEFFNAYARDKNDKQKIYDPYGKLQGQINNGKFYDLEGRLKWSITKDGKIFDPYGKYVGKIQK
jgi:hypothetical protein